jgi:membrane associated rhomboid family serine protease
MSSIIDELKGNFQRANNALNQLIIINVVVFVLLGTLTVVSTLIDDGKLFDMVFKQLAIPSSLSLLIYKPWTILTYAFVHSLSSLFHILFNMLVLYWFGRLVQEYIGSPKVVNLYVLGALAGALTYILAYNFIPFFADRAAGSMMVGASAAVYAISVAAATLLPDYRFNLLFIGPVRIKYIVGAYIFLSFLGSVGPNAGGNIAHLGGAVIGFYYIYALRNGTDIGLWIQRSLAFIKALFGKQPKIKVTYRKSSDASAGTSKASKASPAKTSSINQDEIDAILDKISEKGYESLSTEEKQKLFNASKK